MASFVLLWNPVKWAWPQDDLAAAIDRTAVGDQHERPWSTGTRRRELTRGDRAFLLRQGGENGLVAVGTFVSEIYDAPHWDGSGRPAPFADVRFDRVVDTEDRLALDDLMANADRFPWDQLRGGGVRLPDDAAASTEKLWSEHLKALPKKLGAVTTASTPPNPPWAWDEIVLALELYFRIGVQSSTHPEVTQLSSILNRLPIHSVRPQEEKFRNANGVNLKLANLAHLDPSYGGAGMARGSKLDLEVFDTFVGDRDRLIEIAGQIRSLGANSEVVALPEPDETEVEAVEGRLLYRRHRKRERASAIVRRKKKLVLQQTGRLACEVCDVDFGELYGSVGQGFIECHHTTPLASGGERVTRLTELALLCSNCHRMVHRARPMLSIDDLRASAHPRP